MKNIFKKIYYNKYTKISYSISGVDLIIDRMFSKIKKGIYIDLGWILHGFVQIWHGFER